MSAAGELLETWVLRQATEDGRAWLSAALTQTAGDPAPRTLFRYVGFASRKLGRGLLELSLADRGQAEATRPGWRPDLWTIDAAGRVALVLRLANDPGQCFASVERLCRMGEMHELVAYYRGLPLYPEPERYQARAAEGLRTNMQVVFEAVAHHNPYPAEQLDEGAWNQMVLKALFIGARLVPMQGLEARANLRLTRMLCDYAHERWAASRSIRPGLWRCVGAAADDAALDDLTRAFADDDPAQRQAAALALHRAGAMDRLAGAEELVRRIEDGSISWETLD